MLPETLPQTWKKEGWPCGSEDGVFVQLEVHLQSPSTRMRYLWFMPVERAGQERTLGAPWSGLSVDAFGLLPKLLH